GHVPRLALATSNDDVSVRIARDEAGFIPCCGNGVHEVPDGRIAREHRAIAHVLAIRRVSEVLNARTEGDRFGQGVREADVAYVEHVSEGDGREIHRTDDVARIGES